MFKVIQLSSSEKYYEAIVMQDYDVNIICIKTEADVKWNLCGRRQTKESNVHISCTKTELKAQSKIS